MVDCWSIYDLVEADSIMGHKKNDDTDALDELDDMFRM